MVRPPNCADIRPQILWNGVLDQPRLGLLHHFLRNTRHTGPHQDHRCSDSRTRSRGYCDDSRHALHNQS